MKIGFSLLVLLALALPAQAQDLYGKADWSVRDAFPQDGKRLTFEKGAPYGWSGGPPSAPVY